MQFGARQGAVLEWRGGLLLATAAIMAVVAFAFVLPQETSAQCPPGTSAADCARSGLSTTSEAGGLGKADEAKTLGFIIGKVIKAAIGISGVIFLVLIVYSGFRWMTAQGEASAIETAKKTITNAAIGLVILALAFAITDFVVKAIAEAQGG